MATSRGARAAGALLLACAVLGFSAKVAAQVSLPEEYHKTVKSAQAVGALGPDLFGDDTSLYTGATTFSVTDVSLRGNNALPISVGRRFVVQSRDASERNALLTRDGGFADWELDIPHLHGVFAKNKGWQVDSWTQAGKNLRCSLAEAFQAEPPTEQGSPSGFVEGFKYWSGNSLYVPGAGDQELLVANATTNPHRPSDGKQYVWVTSNQWYFSCLDQTANGVPGDAFLAVDPNGTRYWFDWFASRHASILSANGSALQREEVWILPTRVEDRFGNSVTYTYDQARPWHLKSITASDGRQLTLTYSDNWISSVSDGTRTWNYVYGNGLTEVVLPDQSTWSINFANLRNAYTSPSYTASFPCSQQTANPSQATFTGTMTHPSGAVGEFSFRSQMHGRSYVQKACTGVGGTESTFAINPRFFEVVGITSKKITGPALTSQQWTYTFGPVSMSWADQCVTTACASTKTLEVAGPGEYRRYTFGNRWRDNDGKLLVTEIGNNPSEILRTETNTYQLDPTGQLYPAEIGRAGFLRGDGSNTKHTPMIQRVITQQGVTFNWGVDTACGASSDKLCFDQYANPTQITRASGSNSRTDRVTFAHNNALWVIGQPQRSENLDSTPSLEEWRHVYDAATALPIESYAFGKLQQKATYNTDGTLATVSDGRDTPTYDTTITFGTWVRGIPQSITYPDGYKKEAWVDPNTGWISWVEDEADYRTCYRYDLMGRVQDVFYPGNAVNTCDTGETQWNGLHRSFARSATADFGIPVGHWKDEVRTGNGYTVTHYDGLWRPVVVERFDNANKAATWTQAVTRYAPQGGVAFQSYPGPGYTDYATVSAGTRTTYDALGRPTRVEQDSELVPLVTTHEYLTGFSTRTTSPGTQVTQTWYQAYDQPSTDMVRAILHPENTATDIPRDEFGKPKYITRRAADWSKSLTRYYTYNDYQELCRTSEPETGVTLMGYDAAGNLAWSASGLAAGTPCEENGTSPSVLPRRSTRTYDNRNRLTELTFADDQGEQVWTYTPDGLPATVWTYNGANRTLGVHNAYSYNSRRMLGGTGESLHEPGWTWSLGYGYDKNGFLTVQVYPDTTSFTATVNALGQTTGITGTSGTYVSGASYHPNGALKQFTYGNGIVHTLEQNARGLPDRSKDAYGGVAVLDDSYDYDFNGNVASISDGRAGASPNMSRTMTYDDLDRLTSVTSPMFNGTISYTYDVFDNIETLKAPANNLYSTPIPARDLRYCYKDGTNRLQFLRSGATDCSSGQATTFFDFDDQGNIRTKDAWGYKFSYDNRLREVSFSNVVKETYRYDANGRRVTAEGPGLGKIRSYYNKGGQLSFQADGRTGKNLAYVYLNGSLVATREQPTAGGAAVLKFHHTDALGSPVVTTNSSRSVIETSKYEPYGSVINRAPRDGHGFTGHIEDAQTGLNYMQQRYYDPELGRFLSVDPVAADSANGGNFNRFKYASNSPYRFTDPDGRAEKEQKDNQRQDQLQASTKTTTVQPGQNTTQPQSQASSANVEETVAAAAKHTYPEERSAQKSVGDIYAQCLEETTAPIDLITDNPVAATATTAAGAAAAANVPIVTPVVKRGGLYSLIYEVSNTLSCAAVSLIVPIQSMQGPDAPLNFLVSPEERK